MSKIDDLYKRAFGTGHYSYDDANWDKMESILDDSLPASSTYSWLGKVASFTIIGGLTLFGTLFNSPSKLGLQESTILISQNLSEQENQKQESIESKEGYRVGPKERSEMVVVKDVDQAQSSSINPRQNKPAERTTLLTSTKLSIEEPKKQTDLSSSGEPSKPSENYNTQEGLIGSLAVNNDVLETDKKSKDVINTVSSIPASIRSFTSLAFIEAPSLEVNIDKIDLSAFDFNKHKAKIKLRGAPQYFVGLGVVSQRLNNDEDLNINVNDEIKNVALVDLQNNSNAAGLNFGLKWKGIVVSSGLLYKRQSSEYKIYYSHTNNWEEQNINSETNLARVNKTYVGSEMSTVERDGQTFWLKTPIYEVDSVFETTIDTSYVSQSSTQELDEKFAYKINYVSIPLTVGYEYQINKFFVSVNVGMNMDILSNVSGNIYNTEENKVISFNDESQLQPVVYSANASVGLGYNISPKMSFTVQPRVSKSLNSTFKDDSDFATTYQSVGANFMLRYNF